MPAPPVHVPVPVRIGAVVVMLLAIALGIWQIRRDGERNAGREAALLVADLPVLPPDAPVGEETAWRRVRWQGHFDGAAHLESGRSDGIYNGYGIFQRFRLDDGRTVLVDRGWVPPEGVAERARATALDTSAVTLTGQLRPLAGDPGATPVEGHGTRIWPPRSTEVLRLATGSELPLYLMAGPVEGGRTTRTPPLDGFERVPARDDTSAHYALQWFAIALLAGLVAVPKTLTRLRQFVDA